MDLSDRFAEHLRFVITQFTDMNDCAISPISGGNNSRKSRMIYLFL